jgi:hypothetical protein
VLKSRSIVVALAAAFAAPAHANLIVNGGFETGAANPWVVTGPDNNVVIRGPLGGDFWFGGGSTAQNGSFAAMFNAGDRAPVGTISQTFATVPNEVYQVTFDYGATLNATQRITASVLGTAGLLFSLPVVESNPLRALTTFTFAFVADGGQATLRFVDDPNNFTVSQDGILDNVSVIGAIPVPEPETYALMLAGLGLLGFRLRRRRGTANVA